MVVAGIAAIGDHGFGRTRIVGLARIQYRPIQRSIGGIAVFDVEVRVENSLPIGSGVTEAACKTLVKQRLYGSGMRWKDAGIKVVLSSTGADSNTKPLESVLIETHV